MLHPILKCHGDWCVPNIRNSIRASVANGFITDRIAENFFHKPLGMKGLIDYAVQALHNMCILILRTLETNRDTIAELLLSRHTFFGGASLFNSIGIDETWD